MRGFQSEQTGLRQESGLLTSRAETQTQIRLEGGYEISRPGEGDAAARHFFMTPLHLHHSGQRGKYHKRMDDCYIVCRQNINGKI